MNPVSTAVQQVEAAVQRQRLTESCYLRWASMAYKRGTHLKGSCCCGGRAVVRAVNRLPLAKVLCCVKSSHVLLQLLLVQLRCAGGVLQHKNVIRKRYGVSR